MNNNSQSIPNKYKGVSLITLTKIISKYNRCEETNFNIQNTNGETILLQYIKQIEMPSKIIIEMINRTDFDLECISTIRILMTITKNGNKKIIKSINKKLNYPILLISGIRKVLISVSYEECIEFMEIIEKNELIVDIIDRMDKSSKHANTFDFNETNFLLKILRRHDTYPFKQNSDVYIEKQIINLLSRDYININNI